MSSRRRNRKTAKLSKLVIWLGVFLSLLIGSGIWYVTGDISGTWRSQELEEEIRTEVLGTLSAAYEESDLHVTDWVVNPVVSMEVEGRAFDLHVSFGLDRKALQEAYSQVLETQYQHILQEVAQAAQEEGVDKEVTLKQLYGENYEAGIKATLPSAESIVAEFDQEVADFAADNGYHYDAQTGLVSAHFAQGTLNPLTRQVQTIDFLAHGLVEETGFVSYRKKGEHFWMKVGEASYLFQRPSSKE